MPEWLTGVLSSVSLTASLTMVAAFFYWKGRVDTRLDNIKESADKDREAFGRSVEVIQNDIKTILRSLPPALEGGSSPLSLTDLGSQVSAELDAETWARDQAGDLAGELLDKSAYEIQEFCFTYVKQKGVLTDDLEREIKESAYLNGVTVEAVRRVLAIELRDQILFLTELDAPE